MYYYYTRWEFCGDESLEKGIYHSTWESPQSPREFLDSTTVDRLLEFRRFASKEEMEAFAAKVGLTNACPCCGRR